MFNWYKAAQICYAHLSDVHLDSNCYSRIDRHKDLEGRWHSKVRYALDDSSGPVIFRIPTSEDLERLLRTRCPTFFRSRWFSRG